MCVYVLCTVQLYAGGTLWTARPDDTEKNRTAPHRTAPHSTAPWTAAQHRTAQHICKDPDPDPDPDHQQPRSAPCPCAGVGGVLSVHSTYSVCHSTGIIAQSLLYKNTYCTVSKVQDGWNMWSPSPRHGTARNVDIRVIGIYCVLTTIRKKRKSSSVLQ